MSPQPAPPDHGSSTSRDEAPRSAAATPAALAAVALLVLAGLAALLWLVLRGDGGAPVAPAKNAPEAEAALPAIPLPRPPPKGAPRFATVIDADAKAYEAWLARMRADGLRPVSLHVRDADDGPRFQAVALRDDKPVPWQAPLGLDEEADVKRFRQLAAQHYRLACRCGYLDPGTLRFASLWSLDSPEEGWYAYNQQTGDNMSVKVKEMIKEGFRAAALQGYSDGKQQLFSATFVPDRAVLWEIRKAVLAARLDDAVATRRQQGLRPVSLSAYPDPDGPLFAVVWVADKPAPAWELRQGLTAAQYREEEDHWTSRGYRPQNVTAYVQDGQVLYAAVWARDAAAVPLPRTGRFVPELEPFDRALTQFMRDRHIPAGALAVVKDGRLVLSRGYGYADREWTKPLPDGAPFRLASLSKMMTAAAVRKLIREGKLTRATRVFELLVLEPLPGKALDPRWKKVTVGHLLDHQGGWDTAKAKFDPMFYSTEISAALGKPGPASAADVIRYMAGQPLQFEPGTKTVYSNFGYCLLGRVIEKVSGKPYLDYLRSAVLEPAGIKEVVLGRTLPGDRDPREPFYSDPNRVPNVMRPESKDKVPEPDGGFCVETMDSHGGLTAPAVDVARFLTAFALDGHPAGRIPGGAAFGSLPGTFTMALKRPDGVGIVVLFNQRTDPSGLDYFKIEEAMNRTAGAVKRWPAR